MNHRFPKIAGTARKAIALALSLCLAATAPGYAAAIPDEGGVQALSADGAEWSEFHGDEGGHTPGATPRTGPETALKWEKTFDSTAEWSSVGAPVIVGNSIFIAVSNRLYRLGKDGAISGYADLGSPPSPATIGYSSFIAYGDGKIFVPLEGGDIQAFDAATLSSLWIAGYGENTRYPKVRIKEGSRYVVTDAALAPGGAELPYRAETKALYKDGYLYCGVYYIHNNAETYGAFFALDAADDNPSDPYENKPFAWEYEEPSGSLRGYYWAGIAAAGGNILFAGDAGVLRAVREKPVSGSAVTSSVSLVSGADSFARAGMLYEKGASGNGVVWITTKSGRLWRVPFAEGAGAFGEPAWAELSGGAGASIPVVSGDKVYALSGYVNDGGRLDIFDRNSLAKKSTLDFGGYSQSSPLITDAYRTPENGNKVYLYIALNEFESDKIIVIEDGDAFSNPVASTLYDPGGSQSMNSVIADASGVLYFADGRGRLLALERKQPDNVPEPEPEPIAPEPAPTPEPAASASAYKVYLNANGGKASAEYLTAVSGGPYPAAPRPVRKGHTFRGWYFDASYSAPYSPGSVAPSGGDVTIYAKWEANKYKVKFNVNRGKALTKTQRVKTVTYAKRYGRLPIPARGGYKFKGWYTKKKGGARITEKSAVKILRTTTLYARWTKKK
jgi:uncharacterized repeat protein (TIGR02543 family)